MISTIGKISLITEVNPTITLSAVISVGTEAVA